VLFRSAVNIGNEWLGSNHPAVQCLRLGVAVHHGSLPKPFQRAVEKLLRDQILRVIIASPTLAQGLNLSATTLLFHSIYRAKEPIPAEEFLNVAGRAGRALVDVEGQVVCLDFENKHSFQWDRLLRAAGRRSVMSGLLRLVIGLSVRIQGKTGYSLEQFVDYVLNNAAAWVPPPPTRDEPNLPQVWEAELGRLDAALLSLIPHETPAENVAPVLDEVLNSSLWQRSLQRGSDALQDVAQAILRSRARFIWDHSEPLQRKGAFYAGVNFKTSVELGRNASDLNDRLRAADSAFESGNINEAIKLVMQFAETAFTISPFTPPRVIDGWKEIAADWIHGKSLSDLAGGIEAEVVDFIEDALVYRLVWAMEAVRVRAVANEEVDQDFFNGRSAMAVETGCPNYSASILIHCGLSSRIAALKAVQDLNGTFWDTRGMRQWIRSAAVAAKIDDPSWPTQATAGAWRDFVQMMERTSTAAWEAIPFNEEVDWLGAPPPPGTPVRVGRGRSVHSITWKELGTLKRPLEFPDAGVIRAHVGPELNSITGEYLGPRQRRGRGS